MLIDRVVVNASPLIILFKSQFENLLAKLFVEVLVPGAVWDEVVSGSVDDIASRQLPAASWARRIEVPTIDPIIMTWDLERGESEVLTFALNNAGYRAMV